MDTLAERLTWAREQKGLTQAALAKLSGVTQSTIGNLESGLRLSARKIIDIATALEVDPIWLANGQGNPQSAVPAPNAAAADNTSPFVPAAPRIKIGDEPDTIPIRRVRIELRAGFTGFETIPELEDGGVLHMPRQVIESKGLIPHELLAIGVKGDSMEPMFLDGDVVVVNTVDKTPVNRGVYAINFKNESCIKQLLHRGGQWYLHSMNPDHDMVNVRSGECEVIGRVVYQPGRVILDRT